MEFGFIRAEESDVGEIFEIMKAGKDFCEDSEWYCIDDENYIREHIAAHGFVLKAVPDCSEALGRRIAGFLIVDFPGDKEGNMGKFAGIDPAEYENVAYMDSAAVRPEFRGNKLQQRLILEAERELKKTKYVHLMCTIHPDNVYSLNNMKGLGYEVVAREKMYGGLPRLVLYKRNSCD